MTTTATPTSVHERLCCYDAGSALRYAALVMAAALLRLVLIGHIAAAVVLHRAARRLDLRAAAVPQTAPNHPHRARSRADFDMAAGGGR